MAAKSFGPKGEPIFADTDGPDVAVNPTQAAAFAAKVGNRISDIDANRQTATAWPGLEWYCTDTGLTWLSNGTAWTLMSRVAYPIANLNTWAAVANRSGLFVEQGWAELSMTTHRLTAFAAGSQEALANVPVGARPPGTVGTSAAVFTTSFPSLATVLIDAGGNVTIYNGSSTQQDLSFDIRYKVA